MYHTPLITSSTSSNLRRQISPSNLEEARTKPLADSVSSSHNVVFQTAQMRLKNTSFVLFEDNVVNSLILGILARGFLIKKAVLEE